MRIYTIGIIGEDALFLAITWINILARAHPTIFSIGDSWKYFFTLEKLAKKEKFTPSSTFEIQVELVEHQRCLSFVSISSLAYVTQAILRKLNCYTLILSITKEDMVNLLKQFINLTAVRIFPWIWRKRVLKPTLIILQGALSISNKRIKRYIQYFKHHKLILLPIDEFSLDVILDEHLLRLCADAFSWLIRMLGLKIEVGEY